MNWYRAKTILIIFFICMNAFLLVNLIRSTRKADLITPEIITSTADILSRNNIKIDSGLIPQKTISMHHIEMSNAIKDKAEFAKLMCGSDTLLSPPESYSGSRGSITFDGDSFKFTPAEPLSANGDAESFVRAFMADRGIDLTDALTDTKASPSGKAVSFMQSADSYKVFDSVITALTDSEGKITSISGMWFEDATKPSGRLDLKSVTGVLIDFILRPDRPEGTNTITALELGYIASDYNMYHETVTLLPVWQITLSDGSSYCIDTRE